MASPLDNPESLSALLEMLESRDGALLALVKGNSMYPLLKDGDRLHVRPLQEHPQPGDIIVFPRMNGLVAHRLLTIRNAGEVDPLCLAQGDHALKPDPPVPLSTVTGRAVALQRGAIEISLETPTWRRMGSLVASIQVALLKIRAGVWLRRGARTCFALLIQVILNASLQEKVARIEKERLGGGCKRSFSRGRIRW